MFKELKESMRIMSHKIQNSNKETEIIKCRKELGVVELSRRKRYGGTKFVGLGACTTMEKRYAEVT